MAHSASGSDAEEEGYVEARKNNGSSSSTAAAPPLIAAAAHEESQAVVGASQHVDTGVTGGPPPGVAALPTRRESLQRMLAMGNPGDGAGIAEEAAAAACAEAVRSTRESLGACRFGTPAVMVCQGLSHPAACLTQRFGHAHCLRPSVVGTD